MNIGGIFKKFSKVPKKEIERLQKKYHKELLQPRLLDGELNMEFLKEYGAKNIRLTTHDIAQMYKKDRKWAEALGKIYQSQQEEQWEL